MEEDTYYPNPIEPVSDSIKVMTMVATENNFKINTRVTIEFSVLPGMTPDEAIVKLCQDIASGKIRNTEVC